MYRSLQVNIRDRRALTLVELLVVLSIVAVLSTVALRSVTGVFDEKNYDANVSQLEEINRAILGDRNAAGFLGDIGRLPQAIGNADTTNWGQLAELWDRSVSGLPEFSISSPAGDSEVRLGTGWRGPYLNLGINRRDLSDGFANPFLLYQSDGTLSDNGDEIAIIQSLGADGMGGGASYEEDLEVVFEAEAGAVSSGLADAEINHWKSDVNVTVVRDGGPILVGGDDEFYIVVRAYGADEIGGIDTVKQDKIRLTADLPSHTFTLSDLPHGAKVFRAYQVPGDHEDEAAIGDEVPIVTVTDPPAPPAPPAVEAKYKSPATHIVIDRFTSDITLTLY